MSTHLILLVGTNPLPNYVTAKYLLSEGEISKIWFIFSEEKNDIKQKGTGNFAENLKEVILKNHPKFGIENFGFCSLEDVEDANKIKAKVKDLLVGGEDKIPQEAEIHLNYTGGTKVMSVHVRSVFKECEKLDYKTTFSYLSSRTFKLKYDNSDNETPDLRKEINITLYDLAKLHGYEKVEHKNKYNWSEALGEWANALDELSKIIEDKKLLEFLTWKNSIVSSFRNKKRDKNASPPEGFEKFAYLLKNIPKEYAFLNNEGNFLPKNKTSEVCMQFLYGIFLEQYVYKVLSDKIKKINKKIPLECNWELKREEDKGKKFELDLVLMNSYQVCGISCTVIKEEGTCKQKGFEVVHRANQIGGEEAKAVLVTCLSNKRSKKQEEGKSLQTKELEKDLRNDTDSGDKLIVLGIEDLEENKLWEKISKHMELE